jgi:hypothetical protein
MPDIQATVNKALTILRDAGWEVEEVNDSPRSFHAYEPEGEYAIIDECLSPDDGPGLIGVVVKYMGEDCSENYAEIDVKDLSADSIVKAAHGAVAEGVKFARR